MAVGAGGSLEGPSGRSAGASSSSLLSSPRQKHPPLKNQLLLWGVTSHFCLHLTKKASRSSSDQGERVKSIQAMNQEKE
ncbi:UNVERIFIED_CONTAM: hypothetical protein Sradi_0316100 [Sesamum radiatum]|uniref:Uncharacterized protein n=1 Tax=Sesamum radiatum TaxID=300843 RepID=A0AAW2W7C8_SESRA